MCCSQKGHKIQFGGFIAQKKVVNSGESSKHCFHRVITESFVKQRVLDKNKENIVWKDF